MHLAVFALNLGGFGLASPSQRNDGFNSCTRLRRRPIVGSDWTWRAAMTLAAPNWGALGIMSPNLASKCIDGTAKNIAMRRRDI